MRTVLDQETVVFEEGYHAFESGEHREDNPYKQATLRKAWFDGWDRAQECDGACNG